GDRASPRPPRGWARGRHGSRSVAEPIVGAGSAASPLACRSAWRGKRTDADGCYGSAPRGTSDGGVAALVFFHLRGGHLGPDRRHCAFADAECSTKSPTGCTDRPLVACEAPAKDRCDGNVKLGCDHCGLVSYRDCAWDGGTCRGTPGGAECVPPGDSSAC